MHNSTDIISTQCRHVLEAALNSKVTIRHTSSMGHYFGSEALGQMVSCLSPAEKIDEVLPFKMLDSIANRAKLRIRITIAHFIDRNDYFIFPAMVEFNPSKVQKIGKDLARSFECEADKRDFIEVIKTERGSNKNVVFITYATADYEPRSTLK